MARLDTGLRRAHALNDVREARLAARGGILGLEDRERGAAEERESDFRDEQVLLLEDGHCLRDHALALCNRAGARELDDFLASSLTMLVQMVSGGVGVTLLPKMSVQFEASAERQLKLIPFGAKSPARTNGLAWRPSSLRREEFELLAEAIGSVL